MSIELIDKIKPKNGGSFPLVDADDILMPDGQRLSDFWRNSDVVLEEQTVAGFVDSGTWWGYGSADAICPNLVAGETYRVNWDGTEYICTAVGSDGGMVYVGDPGIAMDEGTGDYPFQIRTDAEPVNGSSRFTCLTADGGESHEIAIYRGEATKELPDVTEEDNGKVLKVVGGAWAAVEDGNAVETAIAEDFAIEGFTEIDGVYAISASVALLELVEGKTYKVIWDGEEYLCECYSEVSGSGTTLTGLFLGNASLLVSTFPDTQEPFCIRVADESTLVVADDEQESHVISLYVLEEAPSLPSVTKDDNGKILQVVDGAWAAVAMTDVSEVGL